MTLPGALVGTVRSWPRLAEPDVPLARAGRPFDAEHAASADSLRSAALAAEPLAVRGAMKSLRWRIFLWGFLASVALIGVEWWSSGWFLPGWILLIVSNPSILLAGLITQDYHDKFGRFGWLAQSVVFSLESAFWWYVVAGTVEAIKRRRPKTA
jgi:hypothetical protein